jgi:hypothetical protein
VQIFCCIWVAGVYRPRKKHVISISRVVCLQQQGDFLLNFMLRSALWSCQLAGFGFQAAGDVVRFGILMSNLMPTTEGEICLKGFRLP